MLVLGHLVILFIVVITKLWFITFYRVGSLNKLKTEIVITRMYHLSIFSFKVS